MSKKQPTYTEKQTADLAAIDEQITEARARLDAAEAARTAADAAQDAQGIVNASAAAEAALGAALRGMPVLRWAGLDRATELYRDAIREVRAAAG